MTEQTAPPEGAMHTLRSRTCVLTRRNASDAAFMRTLWADTAFLHAFHRLAPPLPVAEVGVLPGAPFGLATAAMLMLLHFCFRVNKFNKLYSMVFADNPHSLKTTMHLGGKQDGLLRRHMLDP